MKEIIVADDSPTVRQLISESLSAAGYKVTEAIDGEDAVRKVKNSSVSLLITDLNMPNLDGIELIKQVRNISSNRFLPIIMLTSESQPEKRKEGKSAGASGWITKPFKPEHLLSVVKTVCPA